MAEEASPLISKADAVGKKDSAKQLQTVTVENSGPVMEREWDGPLWKMCGDCDQAGLSTFAYVKMCTPLAWGHNVQRAFGKGLWKHALVFLLLFCVWGVVLTGRTSSMGVACGPHPPHPPHGTHDTLPKPLPKPEELKPLHTDPEQQQFLAGATFNPSLIEQSNPDQEEKGTWVTVEGSNEKVETKTEEQPPTKNPDGSLSQNREIMTQLQAAKNQAAESMGQFGLGRKMLHKHHHDDDEDDDDDDEKEHKHEKDGHKHKHHDDKHKDHKVRPEDTPECHDAMVNVGALFVATCISAIVGVIYASKVRTAIRMRHGIKGTRYQDILAWTFCAPCALCQESRTLARHNVHDGVWYGETVLGQPVAQVPAQAALEAPKQLQAPTKPL